MSHFCRGHNSAEGTDRFPPDCLRPLSGRDEIAFHLFSDLQEEPTRLALCQTAGRLALDDDLAAGVVTMLGDEAHEIALWTPAPVLAQLVRFGKREVALEATFELVTRFAVMARFGLTDAQFVAVDTRLTQLWVVEFMAVSWERCRREERGLSERTDDERHATARLNAIEWVHQHLLDPDARY